MLIGNRQRFAFELVPLAPSWERRYEPEAVGWAGLAIWVSNKNLCASVRAGEQEVRQYPYVPLGPLADWFVTSYAGLANEERAALRPVGERLHEAIHQWGNLPPPEGMNEDTWLDAREAFWRRHFLIAGAEGSRLPNLAFLRQDDELAVTWALPPFASAATGTDMLHPVGHAFLPWPEVDDCIRRLVQHVAAEFGKAGISGAFPWLRCSSERLFDTNAADALHLYCARPASEIAAIFGVGEECLDDTLRLTHALPPSASAACQALRDLPPRPSAGIGAELLATIQHSDHASEQMRKRWLEARASAFDFARAATSPQQAGQLAANGVRDILGAGTDPIADVEAALDSLGTLLRQTDFVSHAERMLVTSAPGHSPCATVLRGVRTETGWGARFEQARALGHALLDPLHREALGAASSPYAQRHRRMRSGAFAAEFLLPGSAVERASRGHLDGAVAPEVFTTLLKHFGIGARTAAHQLFNHGWLSSTSARDSLIEEHARVWVSAG